MAFAYSIVVFANSAVPFENSMVAFANSIVLFENGAVAFVNSVTTGYVIVSLSRINKGSSIGQDPGIINNNARLYTHISLIPVSNKTRLGTSPLIERKNILYRDSIISIDETVLTSTGSITTRRSVSPIVALILTEVITSASSKNLIVDFTRKE